jgi:hypothetical protein
VTISAAANSGRPGRPTLRNRAFTLTEACAWGRPAAELMDRSDSPWDSPPRRPSHADKRRAWRRTLWARRSGPSSARGHRGGNPGHGGKAASPGCIPRMRFRKVQPVQT